MSAKHDPAQTARLVRVGECLYRYSSNKTYYAVLKHGGKIFRQSLKTTDRKTTDRKLDALKKSYAKIDVGAGEMTVAELADRYLASIQYLDDKTKRTRASIAKKFKETWPGGREQSINQVRPSEIQTWLGKQSERVGKATLNEYPRLVRKLFELALADRMLAENPAAGIKQRRLDQPIRLAPTAVFPAGRLHRGVPFVEEFLKLLFLSRMLRGKILLLTEVLRELHEQRLHVLRGLHAL